MLAQALWRRLDEQGCVTHPPRRQPAFALRDWLGLADLAAAGAVTLLAAAAQMLLPAGSWLRVGLACAILFFVPGYLLVEAAVGPALGVRRRLARAAFAVGLSPPVVGLLALATALAPHGFRSWAIVVSVTSACLVLAGVAALRRFAVDDAAAAVPHAALA